jgi:sugar lactone lactonase YvrE
LGVNDDVPVITTFAGGPQRGRAGKVPQTPDAIASHGAVVYIADQLQHVVYRVDTSTGEETVVAGIGVAGFSGDRGPATQAMLQSPSGLAVNAAGELLIGDTRNDRVRKVAADGTITTIAGTGPHEEGAIRPSGDGGPATEARLSLPTGVAVDGAGTVYFVDSGFDRIAAVRPDGTIVTVAGSSEGSSAEDGIPATEAQFVLPTGDPYGIAADEAGNLFIPEPFNRRVRRVDAETGLLSTVASGDPLDSPRGAAIDSDGNLYVVDVGANAVLRVGLDGTISTVAGTGTAGFSGDGGPATEAQLQGPIGVAAGQDGTVFVADRGNSRVRKVDVTHAISSVAGNGPPRLMFVEPGGIAIDARDSVYVTDLFHRVYRIDGTTREFTLVAGVSGPGFSGDGGPARDAQLHDVFRVSVDSAGNLYISDHGNGRVRKVDAETGVITTVAGNGQLSNFVPGLPATRTPLRFLLGTCADSDGNLYIADAGNHCVHKVGLATGILTTVAGVIEFFEGTEGFSGDGGPATEALLRFPEAVALDPDGNLYIADAGNDRVRRVDAAAGVITTVAGGGTRAPGAESLPAGEMRLSRPVALAFGRNGILFVSDTELHRVVAVDPATGRARALAGTGEPGFSGDGGPAVSARLRHPVGIAVDSAGRVLFADSGNQRIRRVEPAG